ncbi:LOW QUALITY PROTEIN: hypothetical protein YC2023_121900 [Brassica napus]
MAWDPQDLLAFFFLEQKCVEIDVEHNNNNNNNNNKNIHSKKRIATILRSVNFSSPVKTAEFGAEKSRRPLTALDGFLAFPKWCCGRRSSSRFKSYGFSKARIVLDPKTK